MDQRGSAYIDLNNKVDKVGSNIALFLNVDIFQNY